MRRLALLLSLLVPLAVVSATAAAQPISIGGFMFEANASADHGVLVPGAAPSFFLCGVSDFFGEPTLPGLTVAQSADVVLSDANPNTEIFGLARLDVTFTDNVVVNEPGPDLVVFESLNPEDFSLAPFDPVAGAFTSPIVYSPIPTGLVSDCGFSINAAQIDLSTFGIANAATVSLLRIDNLGAPGCCAGADPTAVLALHSAIPTSIDIRPGESPNPINLKAKGLVPVALHSTTSFDATTADDTTVTLGDPQLSGTAPAVRSATEDVNGDGRVDRVLFFRVEILVANGALNAASTGAVLRGKTLSGLSLIGDDSVKIVPAQP
jgi:hypothetical protein